MNIRPYILLGISLIGILGISCEEEAQTLYLGSKNSITGNWSYYDIETCEKITEGLTVKTELRYSDGSQIFDQEIETIQTSDTFSFSLLNEGRYLLKGSFEKSYSTSKEQGFYMLDTLIEIVDTKMEYVQDLETLTLHRQESTTLRVKVTDQESTVIPGAKVALYNNFNILALDSTGVLGLKNGMTNDKGIAVFPELNLQKIYLRVKYEIADTSFLFLDSAAIQPLGNSITEAIGVIDIN